MTEKNKPSPETELASADTMYVSSQNQPIPELASAETMHVSSQNQPILDLGSAETMHVSSQNRPMVDLASAETMHVSSQNRPIADLASAETMHISSQNRPVLELASADTMNSSPEAQAVQLGSAQTVHSSSQNSVVQRISQPKAQSPTPSKTAGDAVRYLREKEVARGGLGKIWLALDNRLKRNVALKELLVQHPETTARFWREAHLTAQLEHPSIVPIYDFGQNDVGEAFYTMKLVQGRSLEQEISSRKTLEERLTLLPHVVKICEAIAYAHDQNIIHRDIKPHNVLVGSFGETIVIDWGLAKVISDKDEAPKDTALPLRVDGDEVLTLEGSILGTPAYMPLEQAQGKNVDARADVYSLGALLYHLLSGKAPYIDGKSQRVLMRLLQEPPPPLRNLVPALSQELVALVEKAMARDPQHRFANAQELAKALEPFLSGQQEVLTNSALRRYWKKHKGKLMAGLAVLAVAAVSLAVIFWRERTYNRVLTQKNEQVAEERDKAQTAEREQRRLKIQSQLALVQRLMYEDPRQAVLLLKELAADTNFTEWPTLRILLAEALSLGFSRSFEGHTAAILWLEASPDKAMLASASYDNTISLWNVKTGARTRLSGHSETVLCARFSPDGKTLASTSRDHTMRLWDVATGKEIFRGEHKHNAHFLAFSPDGTMVASSSYENTIRLWSVPERRELAQLVGHTADNTYLAFSKNSRYLITASNDNTARIWNLETQTSIALKAHTNWVTDVAISPEGDQLVTTDHQGQIAIWSFPDGKLLKKPFQAHEASIRKLAYAPNGAFFVTVSFDKQLMLWNPKGELIKKLSVANAEIVNTVISEESRYVVFASNDHTVYLYDQTTDILYPLHAFQSAALVVAISSQNNWIAAGDDSGNIRVWSLSDVTTHNIAFDKLPSDKVISAIAIRNQLVAYADDSGIISLGDRDAQTLRVLQESKGNIVALAFSHNLNKLAVSYRDQRLQVIDIKTGKILSFVETYVPDSEGKFYEDSLHALAFSEDDRYLFSSGQDHFIRMWEIETQKKIMRFDGHKDYVQTLAVSSDGTLLVSSSNDDTVRFWNIETGKEDLARQLRGRFSLLAFSDDDTWLAAAVYFGDSLFVSLRDGTRLEKKGLPTGGVYSLDFTNDNRAVVLSGAQGIWVFDLETRRFRNLFKGEVFEPSNVDTNTGEIQSLDTRYRVHRFGKELPRDVESLRAVLSQYE